MDSPSREEIHAVITAETEPIKNDLRWLRKMVVALAIVTLSPKLGGPDAPTAIAAVWHHVA